MPPQLRTGILIDVTPLTKTNFDTAVRLIRDREPALSVLAFQGQAWTLGGRILIPDQVDERIFELENWNINLSNGDMV